MDVRRRNTLGVLVGAGIAFGAPRVASALVNLPGVVGASGVASPHDFGAKGDGLTDDTQAVQKAIDSSDMIFFPPSRYRLSGLIINASGKYLFGAYKKSILVPIGTGDLITVRGSDVHIRDLAFSNPGGPRTGGSYISTVGSFIHILDCFFENGFHGIVSGSTLLTVSDCDFRSFAPMAGICIQINRGFNVNLDRIRSDHPANAMPFAGINVVSTGDTTITDSNLIHCGTDLLVTPSERQVVASLRASNTFFDTAIEGIVLEPNGGAIVRAHFVNCWTSSHQKSGTRIIGDKGLIDGVTFVDHQSNLNGGHGVTIGGANTRYVYVLGGEMAENKGSGLLIEEKTSKFYLRDIEAGAVQGLKGNDIGIHIKPGCFDYEIEDCILEGNRSVQVLEESGKGFLRGNVGIKTKASGAALIEAGKTSVSVQHGLVATPSPADISITPTGGFGANPLYLDAAAITAVEFAVRCSSPAPTGMPFVWQATCLGG